MSGDGRTSSAGLATGLRRIVIVGASLAGLRAAEALRQRGYDGTLSLIGAEAHLPYDRPPLSKEILRGQWGPDRIALRREAYESLELDLRLGTRATALDLAARRVDLDDGDRLPFDGLLIACGAAARRLRGQPEIDGLHTLRTLDDALALRARLASGPRLVVVGAGFIGAEVAASARSLGLTVTVIEPQAAPMAGALGLEIAETCGRLHRDHGVDLRCNVGVERIEGRGHVEQVVLSDGSSVPADCVVVGVGASPAVDWLRSSGLPLDDGVVCDATCAVGPPGIVAAGDCARWFNPLFGESMRVEHWTNAVEQGVAAAERLLVGDAAARPYTPVPSFWSDQYETKIQLAGRVRPDDHLKIVHGDPADYRFVGLYRRGDRLTGVVAMRRPRHFIRFSEMLAASVTWDDALRVAADPT